MLLEILVRVVCFLVGGLFWWESSRDAQALTARDARAIRNQCVLPAFEYRIRSALDLGQMRLFLPEMSVSSQNSDSPRGKALGNSGLQHRALESRPLPMCCETLMAAHCGKGPLAASALG